MWIYKGKEFLYPDDTEAVGFIYKITRTNIDEDFTSPIYYYGKKSFYGKRKGYIIESDWHTYFGSSKWLLDDIKKYGEENFTREILEICYSQSELTYKEAMILMNNNVLKYDKTSIMSRMYYNLNILGKFYHNELFTKQDIEKYKYIRSLPHQSVERIAVNNGEETILLNLELNDLNIWLMDNPTYALGTHFSGANKNKIMYTNGDNNIFIEKENTQEFELNNPEYYIGSKNKGKYIYIYKDDDVKYILKEDLYKFSDYKIGRGEYEKLYMLPKISLIHKEKCVQMSIPNKQNIVDDYIADGWVIAPSDFSISSFSKWLIKDNIEKKVNIKDIPQYLDDGWMYGRKSSININTISVIKDNICKMIDPFELNEYLNDNWKVGGQKKLSLHERGVEYVCNNESKEQKLIESCKVDEFLSHNSNWQRGQFKRESFNTKGKVFVYDISDNNKPLIVSSDDYKKNDNYVLRRTFNKKPKRKKVKVSDYNRYKKYFLFMNPTKRTVPKKLTYETPEWLDTIERTKELIEKIKVDKELRKEFKQFEKNKNKD